MIGKRIYICLFVFMFLTTCDYTTSPTHAKQGEKKGVPMKVNLGFDDTPSINSTREVLLEVTPLLDVPTVTVNFELPEQIELLNGTLTWEGTMKMNETRRFILKVRIVELGKYSVIAQIRFVGKGFEYGKSVHINMIVTEGETVFGIEPFTILEEKLQ